MLPLSLKLMYLTHVLYSIPLRMIFFLQILTLTCALMRCTWGKDESHPQEYVSCPSYSSISHLNATMYFQV